MVAIAVRQNPKLPLGKLPMMDEFITYNRHAHPEYRYLVGTKYFTNLTKARLGVIETKELENSHELDKFVEYHPGNGYKMKGTKVEKEPLVLNTVVAIRAKPKKQLPSTSSQSPQPFASTSTAFEVSISTNQQSSIKISCRTVTDLDVLIGLLKKHQI